MGRASSKKKVSRAARAGGRPGTGRKWVWPGAMLTVGVLGVLLVVVSRAGNEDIPPNIGDHWHAAYGVFDCDRYLAPFNDIREDTSGIHAHGEGLIHIHPFTSKYTGEGADLEAFGEQVGMELTDTSITTTSPSIEREEGDECNGEPASLRLLVWDDPADEEPEVITEDLAQFTPEDQQVVAIVFAPEGADVPKPVSIANLSDPTAAEEGRPPVIDPGAVPTPGEGEGDATTTTAPAGDAGTTSTTAAP